VSMMLITLPVFMPIVQRLDIDLIWFGVLYLICMQLGLLLPPHGLLLMTMKGVAPKEVTMAHIFRAVVPYVAMSLVLLVIVMLVPAIATGLPNVLGGRRNRRRQAALRQHRRRLDLEARLGLDQATDLDHRHGREMPAHDLAIGGAERGQVGEIFVHVAHVPGQADDVPRRGARVRQHRGDVLESLLHLRHEARGEAALLVLADHAADEHHFAARADAVGKTLRLRPVGGLQHGVGRAVTGRSAERTFGHCYLRVDASVVTIRVPSARELMTRACVTPCRPPCGEARSAAACRFACAAIGPRTRWCGDICKARWSP